MGKDVENQMAIGIEATIRVQYMFKDVKTDMPRMGELSHYTTTVTAQCPGDLTEFMGVYVLNMRADSDPESYCASKEIVKKWKAKLKRQYPDEFGGRLLDDEVIEGAISCSVEDSIKDVIDSEWDTVLAERLGAVPSVPEGHRIGDRFIHLESWKLKE